MVASRSQRAMGSKMDQQGSTKLRTGQSWNKMFGFGWVFFFFFWRLPKWQYPEICDRVQDVMSEMKISKMEN